MTKPTTVVRAGTTETVAYVVREVHTDAQGEWLEFVATFDADEQQRAVDLRVYLNAEHPENRYVVTREVQTSSVTYLPEQGEEN